MIKFKKRIEYSNAIITDSAINTNEKHMHYTLTKWKQINGFGIFNDMSEDVTLVMFMKNLFNVSHELNIYGACIFYTKFKKSQ